MIWQDMIFTAGSVFSLFVLMPTLRDSMANVPLGTSLPSATIGLIYGTTFYTLGMTMSAAGALVTAFMWSSIAFVRSPHPYQDRFNFGNASESQSTPQSPPKSSPPNAD